MSACLHPKSRTVWKSRGGEGVKSRSTRQFSAISTSTGQFSAISSFGRDSDVVFPEIFFGTWRFSYGVRMALRATPCTLQQAQEVVLTLHRHHKPPVGHRFSIAAMRDGEVAGVVVVGRPVARHTDQYAVAEVTRLATDGSKNVCSFLLSRAARAAAAMGFDLIQTFTLPAEGGASLRAAGWEEVGTSVNKGVGWMSRERQPDLPGIEKTKWAKALR